MANQLLPELLFGLIGGLLNGQEQATDALAGQPLLNHFIPADHPGEAIDGAVFTAYSPR
ncbi:hypothetical protein SynMINOS11_01859 [Synechococcus sp. Minos11]|nr:hypothetical protein SynMINOS11_01859 [Synechococcus sp. Minos11]